MDEAELKEQSKLCTVLNTRSCFDFDYKPKEKDVLYIKSADRSVEYIFQYKLNKWHSREAGTIDHILVGLGTIENET